MRTGAWMSVGAASSMMKPRPKHAKAVPDQTRARCPRALRPAWTIGAPTANSARTETVSQVTGSNAMADGSGTPLCATAGRYIGLVKDPSAAPPPDRDGSSTARSHIGAKLARADPRATGRHASDTGPPYGTASGRRRYCCNATWMLDRRPAEG